MNRFERKEKLQYAGFQTLKAAALHLHMSESAVANGLNSGHPVYVAWLNERIKRIEQENKQKGHKK